MAKVEKMKLLVIAFAYNEEQTIESVVNSIPRKIAAVDEIDITVVNDGSTDETANKALQAGARLISHRNNRGLGHAFQTGVRHALISGADYLVTIDGDGQFSSDDIHKLIEPLTSKTADVVTGTRFADNTAPSGMPFVKRWGNRRLANLVYWLTKNRYSDVSCGFRAYSREALMHLTVRSSYTYTHEVFLDLASKGFNITEVPITAKGQRDHGDSKVASSVLRYGFETGLIFLRCFRDYQPLRFLTWLGIPFAAVGAALFTTSYLRYLETDSWLKSYAFIGSALMGLALTMMFLGWIAEMLRGLRLNQEEILYWIRRGITTDPNASHPLTQEQESVSDKPN